MRLKLHLKSLGFLSLFVHIAAALTKCIPLFTVYDRNIPRRTINVYTDT